MDDILNNAMTYQGNVKLWTCNIYGTIDIVYSFVVNYIIFNRQRIYAVDDGVGLVVQPVTRFK